MIFGDTNLFAIEIYKNSNAISSLVEGKGICWCNGEKISKEENDIYLMDVYVELQSIANRDRYDCEFYQMKLEDAFQKLNRTIYTNEEWFDRYHEEAKRKKWFRFDANIITLNLKYKLFIVDGDHDSRLMVGEDDPGEIVYEIYLPKGYLDHLIKIASLQIETWSNEMTTQ